MAFDPDKFLAETGGGFDPDKFLAETGGYTPEKEEKPGYKERVLSGFEKAREENIQRQKEYTGDRPVLHSVLSSAQTISEAPKIALKELPGVDIPGKVLKGVSSMFPGVTKLVKKGAGVAAEGVKTAGEKALPVLRQTPLALPVEVTRKILSTPEGEAIRETGKNVAELYGIGKGIGETAAIGPQAIKGGAKALEGLGKKIKGGELKITAPVARKAYGKSLIEKKQNIIDDIADFGVTKGNYSQAAESAMVKAQQRFDKADELLSTLSKSGTGGTANPIKVALKDIDVAKAPYGKQKRVQKIIDDIIEDMDQAGLSDEVSIDRLIEAKRGLGTDKLFSRGPAPSIDDALEQSIRKKMYLNLADKIGEISPEIKAMNQEAKRLLDVNAALSGAASRTENRDLFGLTDFLLGSATVANPGAIAVSLPWIAGKKVLSGGRLGNIAIRTGRALQGKTNKTIDETLERVARASTPSIAPVEQGARAVISGGKTNYDIPAYERRGKTIPVEDIVPVTQRPNVKNLKAYDLQGVEYDKDFINYLIEKNKPKSGVYRGIYRDDIKTLR